MSVQNIGTVEQLYEQLESVHATREELGLLRAQQRLSWACSLLGMNSLLQDEQPQLAESDAATYTAAAAASGVRASEIAPPNGNDDDFCYSGVVPNGVNVFRAENLNMLQQVGTGPFEDTRSFIHHA